MPQTDPRIDTYIAKAAPFAQPILTHVRALVHKAVPAAEETTKWSMPYFTLHGRNLCSIAAFKAHCAIGFWSETLRREIETERPAGEDAMGQFGRITSKNDLPSDRDLVRYLRRAAELAETGGGAARAPTRTPRKKPDIPVPADLSEALRKNARARKTFDAFSPSHRREYLEWITEAKRPETREKRLLTTVEWLAEGKSRNWKYERGVES